MFTTLNELKMFIGIPTVDTMNDYYLYNLIQSVSESIKKYIGIDIVKKTATTYTTSGNNSQRITLLDSPITTLTTVEVGGTDVTAECVIEGKRTIYNEIGFPKVQYVGASGVVDPNFTTKNIKVTFNSGYVLPTDYTFQPCTLSNDTGTLLFTKAGHGLSTDDQINVYGSLPTNIQSMRNYYVTKVTDNTFYIKETSGVATPLTYIGIGFGIMYKQVDALRTLPYDIEFITKKICERLFGSRNRSLNTQMFSNDFGSNGASESYTMGKGMLFTQQEMYVLDQYKAV